MSSTKNRTGRKQKRIFIAFIILLLGFVSFALLKRGLVNSYLKEFIVKTASFKLDSNIKIIDLDIKILKPSIHARGLRINNFAGTNAMLLAREVKIFFSPFPIFLRKVIIPKIELTDVAVSGTAKDFEKLKLPVSDKKTVKRTSIIKFEIGEAYASNFEINLQKDNETALYLNFSKISGHSMGKSSVVSFSGSGEISYQNSTQKIKNTSGKVKFSNGDLDISNLLLSLNSGIDFRLKGRVFPDLNFECLADIDLEKLRLMNKKLPLLSGKIHIPAIVRGTFTNPTFKGRIGSQKINIKGVSLKNLAADFEGDSKKLYFKNGSMNLQEAEVSFNGKSELVKKLTSSYSFRVNNFRIMIFEKLFHSPLKLPQGSFNGEIKAKIIDASKSDFSTEIKGTTTPLSGSYLPAGEGGPSIKYKISESLNVGGKFVLKNNKELVINTLYIDGKALAIAAQGSLSEKNGFLKYNFSSSDISFLKIDDHDPEGPLNIEGLLKIERGLVKGVGSLVSESISVDKQQLGKIQGSFAYSGNEIQIDRFELEKDGFGFEFSAAMDLKNSYLKKFDVNFTGYEIGNLLKIYSRGQGHLSNVEGSFVGDISLKGPYRKLSGKMSLSSREFSFYARPAGKFALKADFDNGKIVLNDFSFIFKDELVLSGKGYYDLGGDALLSFNGRNLNIDLFDFTGIKRYFGESNVDFNVDFLKRGYLKSLTGSVLLTTDSRDIEKYRILDLIFNSDFRVLSLKGKYDDDKVLFDVLYPLVKSDPFKISLSANDFNFTRLLARKITLNHEKVSSKMSMNTEMEGFIDNVKTWKGEVNVSSFQILKEGLNLSNDKPIEIKFDKGKYNISSFRIIGTETDFELNGSGEIGGVNDLSLEGFANFDILSVFFKEFHRAEGRVDIKTSIEGEFSDISIIGSGKLSNGVLLIRDFPNVIQNLNSDITFSHKKFIFDNVKGEVGGGTINARGLLEIGDFDGGLYFDCIGAVDRVTTIFPADYPGEVSGTITFKGPYFVPTLGGELKVHSTRYSKPWNWRSRMIKFTEKTYSLGIKSDPNVFLNLRINAPNEAIELKNNVADAKLSGNLHILGDDHNIGILGTIIVNRGNVYFLENEFELTGGTVKFTEENSVLALFDVEGETKVKDTEIFLNLRGTSLKPEMILTSQPAKSETDIVSLLTLGVESAELTAGGAQSDLSQNLVTSILTGTIQDNIEKTFRKTKIIDTFQVYPSFSEETRTTELRVGIGKKLPYKMEVLYSTDVNNIGRNQDVRINKGITDNLSLQGIVKEKSNQRVDLGMDLEFKFDF